MSRRNGPLETSCQLPPSQIVLVPVPGMGSGTSRLDATFGMSIRRSSTNAGLLGASFLGVSPQVARIAAGLNCDIGAFVSDRQLRSQRVVSGSSVIALAIRSGY